MTLSSQVASNRLGMSPDRAMRIAQTLYENGYITYMRTDSPNLSPSAQNAAQQTVKATYGEKAMEAYSGDLSNAKGKMGGANKPPKNAQEAHEAIRPAKMMGSDDEAVFASPEDLPELQGAERMMYDLIYRRTLASVMPPAVTSSSTYTIIARNPQALLLDEGLPAADNAVLKASVTETVFDGFLVAMGGQPSSGGGAEDEEPRGRTPLVVGQKLTFADISPKGIDKNVSSVNDEGSAEEGDASLVDGQNDYDDIDNEDATAASISEGEKSRTIMLTNCRGLLGTEHLTRPPRRFTVPSFIHELERVGVGRPSTYSTILEKLKNMAYIIVDGKSIIPTVKGLLVSSALEKYFPALVEPSFTAGMEESLDEIATGRKDRVDFLKKFYLGEEKVSSGDTEKSKDGGLRAQAVLTNFTDADTVQQCKKLKLPSISHLGELEMSAEGLVLEKSDTGSSSGSDKEGAVDGEASPTTVSSETRWRLPAIMERDLRAITPEAIEQIVKSSRKTPPTSSLPVGKSSNNGQPVYVRSSAVGRYVQIGEDDSKSRSRGVLPAWVDVASCHVDQLEDFAALPRNISDTNHCTIVISVRNGVLTVAMIDSTQYAEVPAGIFPSQVTTEMASSLMADSSKLKSIRRVLGEWNGEEVSLESGAYGPYVTCKGICW